MRRGLASDEADVCKIGALTAVQSSTLSAAPALSTRSKHPTRRNTLMRLSTILPRRTARYRAGLRVLVRVRATWPSWPSPMPVIW
jgi:hypothetical protein